ncbi:RdgB/HAM1 family non-canonical purine NTP pyrophosphatase [Candidatus Micrarchaeota archaeon]|nr:RdgB/HAM1 family non-canonical purine NTP pyrophosphatase [Candidatus Micrarchaeota archaeon]
MEILFATSNKHKFEEAKSFFGNARPALKLTHQPFDYSEIRSDNVEEIAKDAAAAAYKQFKKPLFVEDSGLFINSLNDFPGTFSAWTMKKIGNIGILRLMSDSTDRTAKFVSCIAYHDGKKISTFIGTCEGSIAIKISGVDGFGYDPIFIPQGEQKTFAQSIQLKNKLSHRYKVLLKFCEYLHD